MGDDPIDTRTPRERLQDILEELLGSEYVYFQPPSSIEMTYPCIVFSLNDIDTKFANNGSYAHQKQYTITVIDVDPDSIIPDKVANLPRCSFNRHFVTENLYHNVFNIYISRKEII